MLQQWPPRVLLEVLIMVVSVDSLQVNCQLYEGGFAVRHVQSNVSE